MREKLEPSSAYLYILIVFKRQPPNPHKRQNTVRAVICQENVQENRDYEQGQLAHIAKAALNSPPCNGK